MTNYTVEDLEAAWPAYSAAANVIGKLGPAAMHSPEHKEYCKQAAIVRKIDAELKAAGIIPFDSGEIFDQEMDAKYPDAEIGDEVVENGGEAYTLIQWTLDYDENDVPNVFGRGWVLTDEIDNRTKV